MEQKTRAQATGGRTRAFRILAGFVGVATVALTVPFAVLSFTNDADSIHRMHNTSALVMFGGLLGLLLLVCARRPDAVASFRVVGAASVAGLITGVLSGDLVGGGSFIAVVVFVGLWALHPRRSEVAHPGGVRFAPAALAAAGLIPGVAWALTQSRLQRNGVPVDPHTSMHHYSSMASVGLTLPLAGLAASLDGAGRTLAARFVGGCAVVTGLASVLLQDHAGAFDAVWSWLLVVGGVVYLALSEMGDGARDTRVRDGIG